MNSVTRWSVRSSDINSCELVEMFGVKRCWSLICSKPDLCLTCESESATELTVTACQVRVIMNAASWVASRVCVCAVINLCVYRVTCVCTCDHRSGKVTLRVRFRVRFRVYEETHLLDLCL